VCNRVHLLYHYALDLYSLNAFLHKIFQSESAQSLENCHGTGDKGLANAKRPCDCRVLYLRPKSSLCSYPDCILDITSFGSADSMRRASNSEVGQFKRIFQQNFVADLIRLKLNFIPKN